MVIVRPSVKWSRYLKTAAGDSVYDVAIVGAGMVGAAMAASLNASPLTASLKVALLDAKVKQEVDVSEVPEAVKEQPVVPEMRVSTLTAASVTLLKRCRAWDRLEPPHSASVDQMQVWDYGSDGYLRWTAKQAGYDNMGYVAENTLIVSSLLKSLHHVDTFFPSTVTSLNFPGNEDLGYPPAVIQLKDGSSLRTRLVVGADGALSKIRLLAGISTSERNYGQRGLVATVEMSSPDATAWQRFLPTGPFALLPVRNGYFNVVWSTTEEMATALESADDDAIVSAFNEVDPIPNKNAVQFNIAVSHFLQHDDDIALFALHGGPKRVTSSDIYNTDAFQTPPEIKKIIGGKPRSFPLKRRLADRFAQLRLALIGDACRSVHPLAGQGVNLGFGDVTQLQAVLEHAVQSGQDIGGDTLLENAYQKKRRLESAVMMTALDVIRDLFERQDRPFPVMRSMGLGTLNRLKPIKNEIMLYAMGLRSPSSLLHWIQ